MSPTDDSVAKIVVVDVGVRSLLLGEARRRAVTRVFGVPPQHQSQHVKQIQQTCCVLGQKIEAVMDISLG